MNLDSILLNLLMQKNHLSYATESIVCPSSRHEDGKKYLASFETMSVRGFLDDFFLVLVFYEGRTGLHQNNIICL